MMKFNTVGLFVTEMEKMVLFYKNIMGLKTDWNGTANAELYSGEMRLIMFSRKDFETMTNRKYSYTEKINGTMELSFDVPTFADVDKEYKRVVEAGAIPVFPPTTEDWGQRTCYVADPDNNLIEISSFTPA